MSLRITISPIHSWCHAAAVLAVGLATISATSASAQSDRYSVKRTAQAATSGVRSIRVENGSGKLVISGKAGATAVNASAVVRGTSQSEVNSVKLLTEREGDVLVVRVDEPEHGWRNGDGWSADLTVEVPNNVQLDVRDGSGGARIENVGPLSVVSGSGGVQIAGANGSVSLSSGSGGAQVHDVHGDVVMSTGSGGIILTGVTGAVDVRSAGSGGVTIRQVSGALHLGSIGSGSLTVDHIGGDLTVDRKGSGSVHYSDVKGRVSIPEREHGRRR
jgi:hypothetical protein